MKSRYTQSGNYPAMLQLIMERHVCPAGLYHDQF